MSADVEKLWELQTVLSQLGEREKQMSVKPEAFAVIDDEYQSVNAEMTRLTESLDQMLRLFANLGFRPVAVIRKLRRPFHLVFQGRAIEVVLDVAEGLGEFAEVEAIAASEADLAAAQGVVLALGRALGLTEVEPRSYLRMTLERRDRDA